MNQKKYRKNITGKSVSPFRTGRFLLLLGCMGAIIFSGGCAKTDAGEKETELPYVANDAFSTQISDVRGTNKYSKSLPVLYLTTEQDIGDEYISVTVSMDGNNQFEEELLFNGEAEIRLRGNSTRYRPKQPYKLKLSAKTKLFGMDESKHWVLLANDIDHTLIRNKLVLDFANAIGMRFAPDSVLAAVVVNDVYQGVYQICEQIRVEKGRIDIFDWEELAEELAKSMAQLEAAETNLSVREELDLREGMTAALTKDYSWLQKPYTFTYEDSTWQLDEHGKLPAATGGFLLEMDFYALNDPSLSVLTTNFMQPFYFNTPERVARKSELYQYAKNYLQSFEYALHSDTFTYNSTDAHYRGTGKGYDWNSGSWNSELTECTYTDATFDGFHYTELFDLDSLVQNFLVCELTANWDSMKNSVFVYKDIDGLAVMGPVWDFDWAFGNINMYNIDTWYPTGWQTTNNYFANEQYYQSVQWNRYLIRDPYFVMKVYEKYQEIRQSAISGIVSAVDGYRAWLSEDGISNDRRWSMTYKDERFYAGKNSLTFSKSFEQLKEFITIRVEWMDQQFTNLDTLIESLGAYKSSENMEILSVVEGKDTVTVEVAVTRNECTGVYLQVNGTDFLSAELENGKAAAELPKDYFTEGGDMIMVYAVDAAGAFLHQGAEIEAPAESCYFYLEENS